MLILLLNGQRICLLICCRLSPYTVPNLDLLITGSNNTDQMRLIVFVGRVQAASWFCLYEDLRGTEWSQISLNDFLSSSGYLKKYSLVYCTSWYIVSLDGKHTLRLRGSYLPCWSLLRILILAKLRLNKTTFFFWKRNLYSLFMIFYGVFAISEWRGDCLAKNQINTVLKQPFRSYLYKFPNRWRHRIIVLTCAISGIETVGFSTKILL
jgi:hypothetical protein